MAENFLQALLQVPTIYFKIVKSYLCGYLIPLLFTVRERMSNKTNKSTTDQNVFELKQRNEIIATPTGFPEVQDCSVDSLATYLEPQYKGKVFIQSELFFSPKTTLISPQCVSPHNL